LNDDLAYELAQYTYACLLWIMRYIENHDLQFERKDRVDILEFHLKRIGAMFAEIEEAPTLNPIKSRMKQHIREPADETVPIEGLC
jgi:hypothetical protein